MACALSADALNRNDLLGRHNTVIFLCADTHGKDYLGKVKSFFDLKTATESLCKEKDYLIILGDAAICWDGGAQDAAVREFYLSIPVTTLFLDGNHENFDILENIPTERWHGGEVHLIASGIIHLMRGEVYDIDGRSFFVFGGADSYNKAELTPGLTWWEQELPTEEDYRNAWTNLKLYDFSVDYMLSHAGPYEAVGEIGFGSYDESAKLAHQLQRFADNTDFREYYFGHFHEDATVEQFHCIMDEIVVIE